MNIELLRDIQRNILAHSDRFVMSNWLTIKDNESVYMNDKGQEMVFDSCGTAGCIAGWACIIKEKNNLKKLNAIYDEIPENGQRYLELDKEQKGRLFFVNWWPAQFAKEYQKARSQKQRAEIAVARIEHFIQTQGRE